MSNNGKTTRSNTRTNLNLGSDKRCQFVNNKCETHYDSCNNTEINTSECETHYDSCNNTEINTSDKCKNNIPSDNSKKC